MLEHEKRDCLARGGDVRRVGISRTQTCVETFEDAGAECLGSRDCQGECILRDVDLTQGQSAVGTCSIDSALFGCYTIIEEGKSQGSICVD